MERRPLTTGIHAVPNANPDAVRRFVTQEAHSSYSGESREVPLVPRPVELRPSTEMPTTVSSRPRKKSAGVIPVGLIPVTVRLRPELAGALKRASLERQLAGEEAFTQQELVELALEPWLKSAGYID